LNAVIEAEFTSAQLRDLAKWLGVTPRGNSRVGLIEQVVEALQARVAKISDDPNALLEGLSPEQQEFARRLLTARDHELPIPRTAALQVWAKVMDERRLSDIVDALRRRALLFPTHAFYPSSFRDVYYQWLPLGPNIPVVQWDLRLGNSDASAQSPTPPPQSRFLEDFDIFLSAILQSGLTVRAALPQHKNAPRIPWLRDWEHDAEEAERVLRSRPNWVPEPTTGVSVPLLSPFTSSSLSALENQTGLSGPHIEFLFAIACALQLIESPSANSAVPTHVQARTSGVEEWLVLTNEQRLRRAWKAWSEEMLAPLETRNATASLRANDAFKILRAIGARDFSPAIFAAEWCALRRYVLRVLKGLPAQRWIGWNELSRRLFEFYPDAAWTFATKADWWFALNTSGARISTSRAEEWHHSIGRIIEHILKDSLVWFGVVEVHLDDNSIDTLRVTELGEALLGARAEALPEHAAPAERKVEPIEWTDKTVLRVPPAPNRAEFIGIIRQVAERGAQPFTYTFTPTSIEHALSQGLTMDDVTAHFKRMKVTVPKPISEQFKTVSRRYGRVRVYQSLTVLELSDDFAAKELAASTSFAKHVIYQISPRAFVLPDAVVDALIEELQAKGYTPRVK
jgi:hypothetical protein